MFPTEGFTVRQQNPTTGSTRGKKKDGGRKCWGSLAGRMGVECGGSGPDTNSSLLRAGNPLEGQAALPSQLPGIGENHPCFGSQESAAGEGVEVRVSVGFRA